MVRLACVCVRFAIRCLQGNTLVAAFEAFSRKKDGERSLGDAARVICHICTRSANVTNDPSSVTKRTSPDTLVEVEGVDEGHPLLEGVVADRVLHLACLLLGDLGVDAQRLVEEPR